MVFYKKWRDIPLGMISIFFACCLLYKGYVRYLAHIYDTKTSEARLVDVPIVWDFLVIFSDEFPSLSLKGEMEFAINLILGTKLISLSPYRMTLTTMNELKTQLQDLVDKGFMLPGVLPWGTLVLFVKNKDGTTRLCINYHQMNKVNIYNKFIIQGAKVFSKIDMRSGYCQLWIKELDIPTTTFRTRYSDWVFGDVICTYRWSCHFYRSHELDFPPIHRLVYHCVHTWHHCIFKKWGKHKMHLSWVLQILKEYQLYVKFNKCKFLLD